MYFFDTNVFLEVLLGQEHAADCQKLFFLIEENKLEAVASKFSIYSICVFLCRRKNHAQAKKFLEYISSLSSLRVQSTDLTDEMAAVEAAEKLGLDFDDAIQVAVAQALDVEAIVSFDHDFDKTGLKRLTPAEII